MAMTVVMYMGSAMMGLKMDMPMTLGTMFLPRGRNAWMVGLGLHLMMGAVFFIIYAALIAALDLGSAVAAWTTLFGVVHAFAAGAVFGMMPVVHPRMAVATAPGSEAVLAPGFFGMALGKMAPMAIVGVHAVYGVVGGAIYAA